ncbi:C-type lectin domain family 4 member M-like [Esox lucius]|uniref:C-type lectin domain-containing protein n=1 Tax=Esox lucius TaxID=8010 RepID=A0A3P8Y7Q0_ESOLU|nr:C-type lectin domain family 4 member M-like [Esox lucius]
MSEGIFEFEGNVTSTNIDCPLYGNVGADKPKPGGVVIQHSDSAYCQVWKRPSGVAALCLGLLCVLLLAGIIGLSVSYGVIGHQYFTERDKLQTSNKNLTEERDQLQTRYKTLIEERDQLQTNYNNLTKKRDQLQRDREIFQRLLVKCPNGWKVFDNSIYYISTEQNNWEYANQDCLKRGAQLVIINNQEEQIFLITLNIRSWIGLTDVETEGTWKWVDGTPLTTVYWGEKEPNSGGNENKDEDCAEMNNIWYNDPVKKWNDFTCNTQLNWICEKPFY